MAVYNPDYDYIEGKKIIDELTNDNERDRLIKYYFEKQLQYINSQDKRIEEYHKFFVQLNRFLPNNNPTFG